MMQAPRKGPDTPPVSPVTHAQKRRTEINLNGPLSNWAVHFAGREDFSDAITFRRGVQEASSSDGASRYTLSFFSIDGSIKFRDSRGLVVRSPDRDGRVRELHGTIWASVEIKPKDFDVLLHEGHESEWITLIKLRPGRTYNAINNLMTSTPVRRPLPISHEILRLWNQRLQIEKMRYLAVVVHNHREYIPWNLVLQREILGPVMTSSPLHRGRAALLGLTSEREIVFEPSSSNASSNFSDGEASESQDQHELVDPIPEKPAGQTRPDPFRNVWEHALRQVI